MELTIESIEENRQEKTCCFTGHRRIRMNENELRNKLREKISKAITKGYKYFICGGAIGFDMIAAEQVIFLRCAHADIKLELAIPCQEQDKRYSKSQKQRYASIIENANKIHKRDLPYDRNCMQQRNMFMVSQSSLVIAHFDGSPSGTKNTIDYARQKDKEIWLI